MNDYGIFYAYWSKKWIVELDTLIKYLNKADQIGFDILEIHIDAIRKLSEEGRKNSGTRPRKRTLS